MAIALTVVFSLIACSASKKDSEDNEEYITIGKVCAQTGSLNYYSQGSPEIEEKAIEKINKDGGIFIKEKNKKLKIKIIFEDSHSTSNGARDAAIKLIEEDKADIIIVSESEKIVTPVSEVCEQKGVPCISVNARGDLWLEHGPFEYSFNAAYDITSIMDASKTILEQSGVTNLAIMAPNNDYGTDTTAKVKDYCLNNKITLTDYGRFEEGITDYETTITLLKNDDIDGLICFMDNSDFEVFFKQAIDKKIKLKQCILINDTYLDLETLNLGDTKSIATIYQDIVKQKNANIDIALDILKRAQSKDADEIVKVARKTSINTDIGEISFNDKHQAILPGKFNIINR
ncbi:MAG: ABC transporter substrate-binding protein [Bacillota bacterium]|nr:ABC transporter substrate-binding protein [Bacillota bacterium]